MEASRLLEMYQALEEKEAKEHNWSVEHLAYHQIATDLRYPTLSQHVQYLERSQKPWLADEPATSLYNLIKRERLRLDEKEEQFRQGLYHGNPERYREDHQQKMVLFGQALSHCVSREEKQEQER